MESSDESFVWTTASNDSDSDTHSSKDSKYVRFEEVNNMKAKENSSAIKIKTEPQVSVKENINSKLLQEDSCSVSKRKNKIKCDTEEIISRRDKNTIKTERDVEDDKGKLYEQSDDSYLNMKVKEEQLSVTNGSIVKSKKKKKKEKHSLDERNECDELISSEQEIKDALLSESYVDDKLTIEETCLTKQKFESYNEQETPVKKKKKKNKKLIDETQCELYSDRNETTQAEHSISRIDFNESAEINNHISESVLGNLVQDNSLSKSHTKMSDRIRFEDDATDLMINTFQKSLTSNKDRANADASCQLNKYIQTKNNLKSFINISEGIGLSDDDEICVIKCPKDIDIKYFKEKCLNIDSKTKLKINGQTYDGYLESSNTKLPIVTSRDSKMYIKTFPITACIYFRKRIPKQIPQHDKITGDLGSNNLLTLPETKLRHPLFGANYKKAIDVPADVAECMKAQNQELETLQSERKKRKKHKKKKSENIDEEINTLPEIKLEDDLSIKNKRKRKHSEKNCGSPKKAKRAKHNPNCNETWDSEKAIEETLFNF
ncbi:uncharacterized protein LOC126970244 isoform X1 [Leptidea sinapis]|uniref:uncharacterized protein LOC126970244 isoform X1 n=1 Tax=Leptidea sinapis TaxID=189913 RepID=UPI0021C3F34B|nr:uncharacterized protein LOC126970244 isoform X1 [Leptidea sinapis]